MITPAPFDAKAAAATGTVDASGVSVTNTAKGTAATTGSTGKGGSATTTGGAVPTESKKGGAKMVGVSFGALGVLLVAFAMVA